MHNRIFRKCAVNRKESIIYLEQVLWYIYKFCMNHSTCTCASTFHVHAKLVEFSGFTTWLHWTLKMGRRCGWSARELKHLGTSLDLRIGGPCHRNWICRRPIPQNFVRNVHDAYTPAMQVKTPTAIAQRSRSRRRSTSSPPTFKSFKICCGACWAHNPLVCPKQIYSWWQSLFIWGRRRKWTITRANTRIVRGPFIWHTAFLETTPNFPTMELHIATALTRLQKEILKTYQMMRTQYIIKGSESQRSERSICHRFYWHRRLCGAIKNTTDLCRGVWRGWLKTPTWSEVRNQITLDI